MIYSAIVPIYKGKQYISSLINSIHNNALHIGSDNMIELIFVNDYPEDEIDSYVEKIIDDRRENDYLANNLKIVVVNNEVNSGIHKSRINGIRNCSGAYVLMLDQDDVIADDYFASQIKHIKNADVVVANGIEQKGEYDKILYKYRVMQWTTKFRWFYVKYDSRIISPGQCLIKKDSIPDVWMNNPLKNNGADDYMLWLLMLSLGKKFNINRNKLYTHVYTASNYSLDVNRIKNSTKELLEVVGSVIGQKNVTLIKRRIESNKKSLLVKVIEKINKEE